VTPESNGVLRAVSLKLQQFSQLFSKKIKHIWYKFLLKNTILIYCKVYYCYAPKAFAQSCMPSLSPSPVATPLTVSAWLFFNK